MNLAPLKYANVRAQSGGPIEAQETQILKIGDVRYHITNSRLSSLFNLEKPDTDCFNSADGTGISRHQLLAQYMSISEALERWAYYYLTQIGYLQTYGFDVEPTTTGMAAFPGLFEFQARQRARAEAEERFCIHWWWRGVLRGAVRKEATHSILEIENPLSRRRVILTWKEYGPGRYAYGTAAAKRLDVAHKGAWLEMELAAHAMAHGGEMDLASVQALEHPGERQILYYSLPEGYRQFEKRLGQTASGWKGKRPKPLIDCLIPGPWQQYTTVWRVLYPMERDPSATGMESDFLY